MKRILVLAYIWAAIVMVAGACLAADPNKPSTPQPVSPAKMGFGPRYIAPAKSYVPPANNTAAAQQAASRQAAARQAAARQAAAKQAAANAAQNSSSSSYNQNSSYGSGGYGPYPSSGYSPYGYGYSPYGSSYSPYGYYPPGTMPYVLAYNPTTGQTYLYPYSGYSPNYYSRYGNPYSYYQGSYLGYGYPSAVFAPAGLLYGLGPIQQLMGVGGWFQQPQANGDGNGNPNPFG